MDRIGRVAFLNRLKNEISEEEVSDLRNGGELTINDFNRAKMVEMLGRVEAPAGDVDMAEVSAMRGQLHDFLYRYMSDKPEGHKWIILACLYLAFIAEEPLHPDYAVKWVLKSGSYFCPMREDGPESICGYCVCKLMEDENMRHGGSCVSACQK
ncbi:MAG: DUF2115 family protein [Eubacteriales bacterium]|nr:DUF2115 family protein [Eubacteriales bacterium]